MKTTNKCQWCGEHTNMPIAYWPMAPINPQLEDKMISLSTTTESWYERQDRIDNATYDELAFYDQLTNTVGKGIVCAPCGDKDNLNYDKYHTLNETIN